MLAGIEIDSFVKVLHSEKYIVYSPISSFLQHPFLNEAGTRFIYRVRPRILAT